MALPLDPWLIRKRERTAEFMKRHGKKMVTCIACNGSGYYDHNGSPACGCCDGQGKVRGD